MQNVLCFFLNVCVCVGGGNACATVPMWRSSPSTFFEVGPCLLQWEATGFLDFSSHGCARTTEAWTPFASSLLGI